MTLFRRFQGFHNLCQQVVRDGREVGLVRNLLLHLSLDGLPILELVRDFVREGKDDSRRIGLVFLRHALLLLDAGLAGILRVVDILRRHFFAFPSENQFFEGFLGACYEVAVVPFLVLLLRPFDGLQKLRLR